MLPPDAPPLTFDDQQPASTTTHSNLEATQRGVHISKAYSAITGVKGSGASTSPGAPTASPKAVPLDANTARAVVAIRNIADRTPPRPKAANTNANRNRRRHGMAAMRALIMARWHRPGAGC